MQIELQEPPEPVLAYKSASKLGTQEQCKEIKPIVKDKQMGKEKVNGQQRKVEC